MARIRPLVTFKSTAFNITEPRSYFINECCFGDDTAKWLLSELQRIGLRAGDKPGQKDFGWYLNFEVAGVSHCFVLLYRSDDVREGATWIGVLERNRGFFGSIFGRRKHGIQASAAQAIHSILATSTLIQDVRWHFQEDFDKGYEEKGTSTPQESNESTDGGE
jgi:hypothetical protein